MEVKAVWMGGREGDEKGSHRDKMVDSVMGVRRPTFKRAYNATRLNSNYVYNSITMMMVSHIITASGHVTTASGHVTTVLGHVISYVHHLLQPYSDYSFEELRLFAPKVKRYVMFLV